MSDTKKNRVFDSYNAGYAQELYEAYARDPDSVDDRWQGVFGLSAREAGLIPVDGGGAPSRAQLRAGLLMAQESSSARAERLAWLTGFTGSALCIPCASSTRPTWAPPPRPMASTAARAFSIAARLVAMIGDTAAQVEFAEKAVDLGRATGDQRAQQEEHGARFGAASRILVEAGFAEEEIGRQIVAIYCDLLSIHNRPQPLVRSPPAAPQD